MPKPKAPWRVRAARASDRAALRTFGCASPDVPWQVDVEEYVQNDVLDWALEPLAAENDPRLLLVFDRRSRELVGVGAHERARLMAPGGVSIAATKIEVVAVARGWQGRGFETSAAGIASARASDVVMSATMTDISARVPARDARVFAVVHEDNLRSLALCKRYGLVNEMSRPHPAYRRLITGQRTS